MNPFGRFYRWVRGGHWELWLCKGARFDEGIVWVQWFRVEECWHSHRARPDRWSSGQPLRCETHR